MNLQQRIESPIKINSPRRKRKQNEDTLTVKSMKYFEFEKSVYDTKGSEKKYYKCSLCKELKNGTKESNLAGHLKSCNASIYSDLTAGKKDPLPLKRLKLLQNCTEIVTVNGRPFNALLDSGFQSTIQNKLSKLRDGGLPLNLSNSNLPEIKKHLSETAEKVRQKIQNEVEGQALSLMVDIVSKHHRSLLGISVQYIYNGELRVRSIGMVELHKQHTGIYLAETIVERLKVYSIEPMQILTITTDNGANVLKMIRDMNEDCHQTSANISRLNTEKTVGRNILTNPDSSNNEITDMEIEKILTEADEEDSDMGALDILFDGLDSDENSTLLSAMSSELVVRGVNMLWDITGVNCAAHTLQLAIKDALKLIAESHQNVISLARKVVIFLRLKSTATEARSQGLDYNWPRLDICTRWGSLFLMVILLLFLLFIITTNKMK